MPSGIAVGNLLLIFAAHDSATILSANVGWTLIDGDANGIDVSHAIFAKLASGGDTCTLIGANEDTAVVAIRITDHGVVNVATDIVLGTTQTGSSANPSPPNCNPGAAQDWLWIEMFAADDDDETAVYWSTNYTGVAQIESDQSVTSCMCAVAFRQFNASSQNPGNMHLGAAEEWVAQTLAIRGVTAVSSTISAALLTTSILTTQIALVSVIQSSSQMSGNLTTPPALNTVILATLLCQGDLTTAIPLAGSSSAAAIVAAVLSTHIPLESQLDVTGVMIVGDLTTQIALEALLSASASVQADLTVSLTVAILGQLSMSGHLGHLGPPGISEEQFRVSNVTTEILLFPVSV